MARAWCADCRRSQPVEDVSVESAYTVCGEESFRVEWLACGHFAQQDLGVSGPAPGAPYAGITAAPSVKRRSQGATIGAPLDMHDAPPW